MSCFLSITFLYIPEKADGSSQLGCVCNLSISAQQAFEINRLNLLLMETHLETD